MEGSGAGAGQPACRAGGDATRWAAASVCVCGARGRRRCAREKAAAPEKVLMASAVRVDTCARGERFGK
jgi:hypothetical protein